MKRILLVMTMAALLLPLAPRVQAEAEVTLNFFYDNLSPYGSWIDVGDYGYCFQPTMAADNPDWRPYADGYWAYTDAGWTWVSYEDFGWATYHYGRWADLADYGWVWVPGYDWAPAWVSWRTGGDYVGWAPLPPVDNRVYEGRAITGPVDVEFGIGPLYYNFVDIRYIGEPVLRGRIFAPARNITIINQTVNVTNITYKNSTVYNYGPNYNRLNQYSTRPIQRLNLQRETGIGANPGQVQKGANLNRVSGNQLMVVAPKIQKSPEKIAPKQVKAKVAKPIVEEGWQGVANRQQLQAEMKKENAKNVPPPSFKPQNPGRQKGRTEMTQQLPQRPSESNAKQGQRQPTAGNAPWQKQTQKQSGDALQQSGGGGKQGPKTESVAKDAAPNWRNKGTTGEARSSAYQPETNVQAAGQVPQKARGTGQNANRADETRRVPKAQPTPKRVSGQPQPSQPQQPQGNKKKKKKPGDQPPDQQ
jgi:Family of unknown function (DUF6600)